MRERISSVFLGLLDETPKTSQLGDDRFSRMEHFYDPNEIDPETLEDLDLGDDGKVKSEVSSRFRRVVLAIFLGWI